jgi:hypothetical protein
MMGMREDMPKSSPKPKGELYEIPTPNTHNSHMVSSTNENFTTNSDRRNIYGTQFTKGETVMNLYITYQWNEVEEHFEIAGIFDTAEAARKCCITENHSYTTVPLELNKSYNGVTHDAGWVYPMEELS